jgi:hypothetical protein
LGCRLIHPQSRFMQGMMVMSTSLLVYTAIIVPVQLCIWTYDDPCIIFPTLPFDIAVDAFFLVEVLVQFFVGTHNHEQEYIDDWRHVASAYLMSIFGFWFDSVTSIPWSFMDLHFYMLCARLDMLPGVPIWLYSEQHIR